MKGMSNMTEKGLVHIYYGNGKGKTTAGMGLCMRAAGCGKKVLVYQFLKDGSSGECTILQEIPGVALMEAVSDIKFTYKMLPEEKEALAEFYENKFKEICFKATEGDFDLLFLDEILHVLRKKMLNQNLVLEFLRNKPENLEVVMTGYDPDPELLEAADYVTRMVKEKHPFDKGIGARAGIEC